MTIDNVPHLVDIGEECLPGLLRLLPLHRLVLLEGVLLKPPERLVQRVVNRKLFRGGISLLLGLAAGPGTYKKSETGV